MHKSCYFCHEISESTGISKIEAILNKLQISVRLGGGRFLQCQEFYNIPHTLIKWICTATSWMISQAWLPDSVEFLSLRKNQTRRTGGAGQGREADTIRFYPKHTTLVSRKTNAKSNIFSLFVSAWIIYFYCTIFHSTRSASHSLLHPFLRYVSQPAINEPRNRW